jgi:hypothetical protein
VCGIVGVVVECWDVVLPPNITTLGQQEQVDAQEDQELLLAHFLRAGTTIRSIIGVTVFLPVWGDNANLVLDLRKQPGWQDDIKVPLGDEPPQKQCKKGDHIEVQGVPIHLRRIKTVSDPTTRNLTTHQCS